MLHRQALASRNVSQALETVFKAAIRAVNYVKYSPLRRRPFAKLCDDVEAEHTATVYTVGNLSLSPSLAKVLQRKFELHK
jgi:hypothetical protein